MGGFRGSNTTGHLRRWAALGYIDSLYRTNMVTWRMTPKGRPCFSKTGGLSTSMLVAGRVDTSKHRRLSYRHSSGHLGRLPFLRTERLLGRTRAHPRMRSLFLSKKNQMRVTHDARIPQVSDWPVFLRSLHADLFSRFWVIDEMSDIRCFSHLVEQRRSA